MNKNTPIIDMIINLLIFFDSGLNVLFKVISSLNLLLTYSIFYNIFLQKASKKCKKIHSFA